MRQPETVVFLTHLVISSSELKPNPGRFYAFLMIYLENTIFCILGRAQIAWYAIML